MATHIDVSPESFKFTKMEVLEEFIGRKIDSDSPKELMQAMVDCEAIVRVMKADALLQLLENQSTSL